MMTSALVETVTTAPSIAQHSGHAWEIRPARRADVTAIKVLFGRLHAYNATLDARFALSEQWECHFDAAIDGILCGDEAICFLARDASTGVPCGFALAAIHRDSDLWRYHEWVEVEALYVDDLWQGRGLAGALLDRTCAWAEGIGQPVVQLYVTACNERAIRFYRHAGFSTAQEIMRKVLA
jgi:GNAT superfamily N-acetyltransferase